jgi:DNA-binding transcriptional ArsR family regulator
MNMKIRNVPYRKISQVFGAIDNPVRIQILLAIGSGEACVCHLEASLGFRQAYISQQLMDLRKHGLISSRREGKYIFHRLNKPEILELVRLAAEICGIHENTLSVQAYENCSCPNCVSAGPSRVASLGLELQSIPKVN